MSKSAEDRLAERTRMVAEVKSLVAGLADEIGRAALDPRVLDAMEKVPRHVFVPSGQRKAAYKNRPLPIGHGQTISQPFIVAQMTDLLQLKPEDKVLEVGTGSGYQTAILSRLVRSAYTIEIIAPLGEQAAATLNGLGCTNVTARIGDGHLGWPSEAPFDGIIVTAAPECVPPALIEQLKPGGRLVLPVGSDRQQLMVVEKSADGSTAATNSISVRFVPMVTS